MMELTWLAKGQLNENKRINTMLISIVVMFGACWLPLNIVLMSCYHDLVVVICHLIAMLSTCINPLFYGFLNKNFQKDLVVLIHHCWRFAPQERYRKYTETQKHRDTHTDTHIDTHQPFSLRRKTLNNST
uniref:G-protein coupled receptors family 1 profile domain-containing protein n=1 Tax=Ursus americanus TaxID=9643 RepID=A0A452Q8E0_URSAM